MGGCGGRDGRGGVMETLGCDMPAQAELILLPNVLAGRLYENMAAD